jgi:peptidyl-prolyl cis-trans isomerase SurA
MEKKFLNQNLNTFYNKNNSQNIVDKKDLNEYVQLFVDLKLKVSEAETQGLDTTKTFKEEFNGYRAQSAKQYLTNQQVEEQVIKDAYNRLKEEVNVSHILIKVSKTASPKDTLEAFKKVLSIRKRLEKEDFAKVAQEVSEDQSSAVSGGYIGYITAFQTVYPFENAAYSIPVGKIGQPVRTQFGYHIVKVNERRPSQGRVLVSHIMKIIPQNASEDTIKILEKKINQIFEKLKSGEDFSALAKAHSDHIHSAQKGGELGWFSTGKSGAGSEFEDTAFNLNIGEYSQPFKSIYGFHILKLIDKKPLESFDEKRSEIQKKIKQDERGNLGVEEFKKALKKEYNFKLDQASIAEINDLSKGIEKLNDSLFFNKTNSLKKPLFSFANQIFYQNEFIDYLKKSPNLPAAEIDSKLKVFADTKLIQYEDSRLEEKYPEFKMLVQEYHDGMLMFEISTKEVWEKASEDIEGLKMFFENNKKNYTWETPRFKGMLVYCKDKKTAKAAKKIIKTSDKDSISVFLNRKFNDDKQTLIK